jgi:UDP-N-acetyl-D-glucosamine dehydrogenase
MTKLLENIFRSVNIALVNELALLCERMGVDVWEVIQAAATKPFGYMPFRPGPGVGGHCIPIDPYYLAWKAREYDFATRFVELAADVNQGMPYHVVDLASQWLDRHGLTVREARVLVLGVAFKPDVEDARHSPAERVIELLLERGAVVSYHDPYIPSFEVGADVFHRQPERLSSVPLSDAALAEADLVLVLTAHRGLDYGRVTRLARLVVDATAACGPNAGAHVLRLGAPPPAG